MLDRKSTRLNSSHRCISYAVFCLKKKKKKQKKKKLNVALIISLTHSTATGRSQSSRLPPRVAFGEYALCSLVSIFFFFFNDTATTEIYTLSLHDALPICGRHGADSPARRDESGECGIQRDSHLEQPQHPHAGAIVRNRSPGVGRGEGGFAAADSLGPHLPRSVSAGIPGRSQSVPPS